jgi:hypothetical protein
MGWIIRTTDGNIVGQNETSGESKHRANAVFCSPKKSQPKRVARPTHRMPPNHGVSVAGRTATINIPNLKNLLKQDSSWESRCGSIHGSGETHVGNPRVVSSDLH